MDAAEGRPLFHRLLGNGPPFGLPLFKSICLDVKRVCIFTVLFNHLRMRSALCHFTLLK